MRQTRGQFRRQTTSSRPRSSLDADSRKQSYGAEMKQAPDNNEVEKPWN
jgi:hypothetical protein